MPDGAHGLSLCHHVSPRNVADAEELPVALRRMAAPLDRDGIDRSSVTLVLDWITAPPWHRAPGSCGSAASSSAQPGVRAAAERCLVHGREYLYVLEYSAGFAGEQLHSLTATLSKAVLALRRLAGSRPSPAGGSLRAGSATASPAGFRPPFSPSWCATG